MGGSSALVTVTLDPSDAQSGGQRRHNSSVLINYIPPVWKTCTMGWAAFPLGSDQIVVGFDHAEDDDGCYVWEYSRGLLNLISVLLKDLCLSQS